MSLIRSTLIVLFILFVSVEVKAEVSIDAPKVLLTAVSSTVSMSGYDASKTIIKFNGETLLSTNDSNNVFNAEIEQDISGTATLEVIEEGKTVFQQSIPVIPGWVSVLPPLIAIILSFIFHSVIPSLFAGLIVGAWAINGLTWQGAINGFFETMTIYILNAMVNPDHGAIILFTLTIGGLVGIISRNGGMVGIVHKVMPFANTPKRGQTIIASLGLTIFFDDYANTLIIGNATRPISDHLKISREKLAYLVDSTAAPVSTIAVITTWIGFQVGLIEDAIATIDGITQSAYGLFLQSIPYSFYPFLAIFFVFVVVRTGKDFGPMYRAEIKAREKRESAQSTSTDEPNQLDEFTEKDGIPCRAINALVPILVLIVGVIGGMYISGDGNTVKEIIGSANAYDVLMWASLLACIVAITMTLGQGILDLNEIVDAWVLGAQFMLTGLLLLVMAWAIADVTNILHTAPYLISILGDMLSPQTLPTVVFLLAAAAGFASGSSWGVMAILMPLVIPLCWAVLQNNGMAEPENMHILYSSIACVLTGAVWSDHCSPISDTTVLSSLATGCDHMDHVRTQIPYALTGGFVAMFICTLPAGFGMPWWLLMPVGAVILYFIHNFLGKETDPLVQTPAD